MIQIPRFENPTMTPLIIQSSHSIPRALPTPTNVNTTSPRPYLKYREVINNSSQKKRYLIKYLKISNLIKRL